MYIKKEKLKVVIKSLKAGNPVYRACEQAGMDVVTLWRWRRAYPKLDARLKDIYESRVQIVEDALYKGAIEGNTTAQIFFLKNRSGGRWRDVYDHKGEGMASSVNVYPSKTLVFQDEVNNESEGTTEGIHAGEGAEGSRVEGKV